MFVHVERTGGTSIREFMARQARQQPDWICAGQACPTKPSPVSASSSCAHLRRRGTIGTVQGMLELLGSDDFARSGCRVFAELHNNEWRSPASWAALRGLAETQRSNGCRTTIAATLRDPYEQVVSELLYFGGHRPASAAQRQRVVTDLAENLLCRLNILGKAGWREATPHVGTAALLQWGRSSCRAIARSTDQLLFTHTLADDWARLQRKHNLSSSSTSSRAAANLSSSLALQHVGKSGNGSVSAALLDELRNDLVYRNRLSRVVFDLLAHHRELTPLQRCEAALKSALPQVLQPPPPPPLPPSPPWVCVPTNASGCKHDEDCCAFVEQGARGGIFCERQRSGRSVCEGG